MDPISKWFASSKPSLTQEQEVFCSSPRLSLCPLFLRVRMCVYMLGSFPRPPFVLVGEEEKSSEVVMGNRKPWSGRGRTDGDPT